MIHRLSLSFRIAAVTILLLLAIGCASGAPGKSGSSQRGGSGTAGSAPTDSAAVAPGGGPSGVPPVIGDGGVPPVLRDEVGLSDPIAPDPAKGSRTGAIIQNASMTLEVGTELDEALAGLQAIADRYGGYIAESRRSGQQPGYREGYAVLRVPSRHFQAALNDLGALGNVSSRHTYTEDVGDQLVDLEVRQRSAEEREQRLRELIGQATEIPDLIALEAELARVRTEIETIAARRKGLEDLVAFSTFTVTLYEVAPGQEPTAPLSVWERTAIAFRRGVDNAGDFASGLLVSFVAALPLLVVIAAIVAPIWFIGRALARASRRRRDARRQSGAPSENNDREDGGPSPY